MSGCLVGVLDCGWDDVVLHECLEVFLAMRREEESANVPGDFFPAAVGRWEDGKTFAGEVFDGVDHA